VTALVISSVLGLMAWQKTKQAEFNQAESLSLYSLSLGTNGSKDLDAFVSAIKAGQILRTQNTTNPEVINALQEALSSPTEQNRLIGHQSTVSSVALSSDGKTLVSGSFDKTIKIWDLATGKELRTLTGHQDAVLSIALSSDGKALVSGSYDKTIKIWDLATGGKPRTLTGHHFPVSSVALTSDGKTLVSGSFDNTIKVWDLATGKELRTLNGHQEAVSSVALSSDGKALVSGSYDKTITVWDFNVNSLVAKSCDWVRAYLHNPNSDVREEDRHLCDGIGTK
jgi:WD40 repeat protein